MVQAHIPPDHKVKIQRAWVAVTSQRSGYRADVDLAVEIDCPEGSVPRIISQSVGRNQIVIGVKFDRAEELT